MRIKKTLSAVFVGLAVVVFIFSAANHIIVKSEIKKQKEI